MQKTYVAGLYWHQRAGEKTAHSIHQKSGIRLRMDETTTVDGVSALSSIQCSDSVGGVAQRTSNS